MKTSTIFPSKYLKAEDFAKPKTVTIKEIEIEKFDEVSKPIASFEEFPKQLASSIRSIALSGRNRSET